MWLAKPKDEGKEEEFKCKLGKLLVEGKEIPIAVCMLGEAVDVRVPDKKLLKQLFGEKEVKKEVK